MSGNSKIEWTDHTFSPWWGCARVSPGCRFCYADTWAQRYGQQVWRRHGPRRMLSDAHWRKPLKWNRDAERAGVPAKVFCASMADVFEDHPDVAAPRERLWEVIEATPWLRWQLLTKRPENMLGMAPWRGGWPDHVWAGTSVENQRWADVRVPLLLAVPAKVRFLSCEPLIGPLSLWQWLDPASPCADCDVCGEERFADEIGRGHDRIELYYGEDHPGNGYPDGEWCPGPSAGVVPHRIDWVICGGESGPKARPMRPEWARELRDECQMAGVPYLFKQWGSVRWVEHSRYDEAAQCWVADGIEPQRVSKKLAGRELDGRTWDQYPVTAEAPA